MSQVNNHKAWQLSAWWPEPFDSSPGPWGYKKIFILNSAEHEIFQYTIVGILTSVSRKNNILGLPEPEKKLNFLIFSYWASEILCSAELSMEKVL